MIAKFNTRSPFFDKKHKGKKWSVPFALSCHEKNFTLGNL